MIMASALECRYLKRELFMSLHIANLSDQLADHLSERIISGELPPGTRLPEVELARTLSVSTNSLREAFHLLEQRHLIEWKPRRGASVCEVTEVQVRDLYDFLFLLLSQLAGRAAERWQPGDIEDLVSRLPDLQRHYDNNDIAAAHRLAFEVVETAVIRFAGNRYLAADIIDLLPLLKRFSYMALQEETTEFGQSLESFKRLMDNVVNRRVQQAIDDIRDYGNGQCRNVLRALAKRSAA
jgi:DNA-binding GntR family transcriptional regulator